MCGKILEKYDFPGNDIAELHNIASAESCCQKCVDKIGCVAWAWGADRDKVYSDVCYLKGGLPFELMSGRTHEGWVAGNVIWPPPLPSAPQRDIMPLTATEEVQQMQPSEQASQQGVLQGVGSGVGSLRNLLTGLLRRRGEKAVDVVSTMPSTTSSALATIPVAWTAPLPTTTTTTFQCGHRDEGIDYPGNDLDKVMAVDAADLCCQTCAKNEECLAWSWHRHQAVCYLKGDQPRDAITTVSNADYVSGKRPESDGHVEFIERQAGGSLYCFALIMPDTYEEGLLAMQYEEGISLFACDEYSVITNQDLKIADAVEAIVVDTDLRCRKGGEFGTALNTDVFLVVWDNVLKLDRYSHHDWIVKVDADCVFSPERLRSIVASHPETTEGVYLNNCQLGMHGPLEVFSRNAVRAFGGGVSACQTQLVTKCSGPCEWGEDMWMDQCLQILRVRRDYEPLLLMEDHCDPPIGWDSCTSQGVAAFHPFKDIQEYRACNSRMGA
jgi:hypothetical protein